MMLEMTELCLLDQETFLMLLVKDTLIELKRGNDQVAAIKILHH